MCYFNGQKVTYAEFLRLKQIEKELALLKLRQQPVIQGFENTTSYILIPSEDKCDFDVVEANWVFVPPSVRGNSELLAFRKKYDTLIARGETALRSPIYRDAMLRKRCLVLSTGFFEFRHMPVLGKKGQVLKATEKFPYRVGIRGQEYFYMAGIYSEWQDQEIYETFKTFAILTTEANELMAQIHNTKMRMPVILPEQLAYEWLLNDLSEERIAELGTYQFDAREMEAWPVAKDFKQSWNTAPVEYEGLTLENV